MTKSIPLTRGFVALVDDEDYARLVAHKWCAMTNGHTSYAVRARSRRHGGRPGLILMHRIIIGATDEQIVDHENGNGLDNRRANLRFATESQNHWNQRPQVGRSSRFKGVSWHRLHARWRATIWFGGRSHALGYFSVETDAARAYDAAARTHFGAFARTNFA